MKITVYIKKQRDKQKQPKNQFGTFPSPGDLPNPGTEPRSPTVQADSLPAEPPGKPLM